MRQAGFLAAAGIYALDHHIDRLAIDHQNIQKLIDFMKAHPKLNVEQPSAHPTNILYFSLADPKQDNPLELVKNHGRKRHPHHGSRSQSHSYGCQSQCLRIRY